MLNYSETRQKLKSALRTNDCNSKRLKALRKLGFSIQKKGGENHYHLLYTYQGKTMLFVMAATGSDKRSGLNFVSDIMRKLSKNGVFYPNEGVENV